MIHQMEGTPMACPACRRMPKSWRERPQYGSAELFWFGCHVHADLLAGGKTKNAAVQVWNRQVSAWKFYRKIV